MTNIDNIFHKDINIYLDMHVSLFSNALATNVQSHLSIKEVLNNIQNGIYSKEVSIARNLLESNRNKYDEYKKKNITGFTLSANCNHRKSDTKSNLEERQNKLIYHTGLLQIDIDKIPKNAINNIIKLLKNDKYTLFNFRSLSGEGLKLGIIIDGNRHKESFLQAQQYYQNTYNLKIDSSVKDIYRLCFVSDDPLLYINTNAVPFIINDSTNFQVSAILQKPKSHISMINTNDSDILKRIKQHTINNIVNKILSAKVGERHEIRRNMSFTAGGHVSGGLLTEEEILPLIVSESDRISNDGKTNNKELQTIHEAFNAGKSQPISKDITINNYVTNMKSNTNHQTNKINNEIKHISDNYLPYCYWYEEKGKNKKAELKISIDGIIEFLISQGICQMSIDENKLNTILIQIKDNVVYELNDSLIRNMITNNFLELLPMQISENFTKIDLRSKLRNGINMYLDRYKLSCLPIKEIEFLQDTKDKAFFFFKSKFAEVSKHGIELKEYKLLGGHIWKSQIIEHDLTIIPDSELSKVDEFDFAKFVENICSIKASENKLDEQRHESLLSTIGYLLHNHKTTANKFAVILTEANLDIDNSKGGTGKGLLLQSIGKLRKTTVIDGKNFSFDSQFAFQNVELDTQILYFDDIKQYFDFKRLFSAITEGLSFERKHKDRINLSAEKSPKIVLSTNYAITDLSVSANRRKYEMELLCYYNDKHKPIDDFGKEFFHSWNIEDWNLFYNFMLNCIQTYFMNNCKIPDYSSETKDEKKLVNATSLEFIEYVNDIERNVNIPCDTFYKDFLKYAGIEDRNEDKPTNKTVGKWLRTYCEHKGIELPNNNTALIEGIRKKCYKLLVLK